MGHGGAGGLPMGHPDPAHLLRYDRLEAAKLMLIDAVLLEEIPRHERLKAWKGESLDTGILFFTIPVSLLADS